MGHPRGRSPRIAAGGCSDWAATTQWASAPQTKYDDVGVAAAVAQINERQNSAEIDCGPIALSLACRSFSPGGTRPGPRPSPPPTARRPSGPAARRESFTRAAEELCVTQGAVSHQVKALEAELGLKLFNRERQRLVITEAGRAYLVVVR